MPLRNPGRLTSATALSINTSSTGKGIFTSIEVAQYKQSGSWVTVPGAPTSVSGSLVSSGTVSVSFTAPVNNGGSAITSYIVTSSPGSITATGSTSPITVSGLTNGTSYTFTVAAVNGAGTGASSSPSGPVTPIDADLTISPALSGKTTWSFSVDGAINITSGSYTITALKNVSTSVKMWGQGGYGGGSGGSSTYPGGAGGALTGTLPLTQGQSYYLTFFGAGTSAATVLSHGGNASGIFSGTSAVHANSIAIAAGGGGAGYDDGSRGDIGGAGGHPNGANGAGYSSAYGRGATQSAGGAAGTASNNGTAGSALQGGTGGFSGSTYGAGGGGGGYYGGGGAAIQASWAGAGGGGGSNYANTSIMTGVTQYSGSGVSPGNSSDSVRNGAGAGVAPNSAVNTAPGPGRIYITV